VHAQGGVTWAELNRETQLHGLAVTGGVVSTTGVAGLTLGGGLSLEEEPDLFWAVRGGGNFGVATSFEFRLHPVGPAITRPTHIDVDVRVVLWWGHADALEFPHPDADFRDAAVVGPVRRRGSA
jgi:FAD/FMN-containing dehydrogenase